MRNLLLVLALAPYAARAGAVPSFEVASVRRSDPNGKGGGMKGGPGSASPERIAYTRVTLKSLLIKAYSLEKFQIAGPEWIGTERYDVAAKVPAGASQDDLARMLQRLLATRFDAAVHMGKREMPVYELVVAKGGPKFGPSATAEGGGTPADAPPIVTMDRNGIPEMPPGQKSGMVGMILPDRAGLRARQQPLGELAKVFTELLGRMVLDRRA